MSQRPPGWRVTQHRRFRGVKGVRPDRKEIRQREAIFRLMDGAVSTGALLTAKATFLRLSGPARAALAQALPEVAS